MAFCSGRFTEKDNGCGRCVRDPEARVLRREVSLRGGITRPLRVKRPVRNRPAFAPFYSPRGTGFRGSECWASGIATYASIDTIASRSLSDKKSQPK